MADVKISGLPASSTPLAGTEVLPIVQGGVTDQVSVANLTAGRAVSTLSLTATANLYIGTSDTTAPASSSMKGVVAGAGAAYLEFYDTATSNGNALGTSNSNFQFFRISGARGSESYTEAMRLDSAGNLNLVSTTGYLGFGSLTAPDAILIRDAANTLAQRNSTNAQTLRVYNSYTSGTSYETLQFDWTTTANTATISTQKGSGGGTVRTLAIGQPLVISPGYTVATLPAGVIGMRAYVTDAVVPTYLGVLTGGGAIKCPVFYNGTAWVSA